MPRVSVCAASDFARNLAQGIIRKVYAKLVTCPAWQAKFGPKFCPNLGCFRICNGRVTCQMGNYTSRVSPYTITYHPHAILRPCIDVTDHHLPLITLKSRIVSALGAELILGYRAHLCNGWGQSRVLNLSMLGLYGGHMTPGT